jgi:molecular chaperone GrpE
MSDSKQTVDPAAPEQAAEQQQSSQRRAPEQQGSPAQEGSREGQSTAQEQAQQTPGAAAPGAADGAVSDGGADGHEPANGAAELKGDLDELGALAAKRDEYLALAQRTQADFENYRKRVARESALAQERGVVKLAKELLPAIDNLDRALDAAATDDPLLEGVRLVRSELSAALARVGVESFSPLGQTFDPSLHEAMATVPQPAEGGSDSGLVVEVYQPGYRLGDSVIRPARVVVAA